ncbi:MAG: ATP-binding cassette domain-containing protein [Calditrichaeota bacterium]|nr:MAG: ATP-binding cassette domain-containing protein [Calditrichota bacterium]
MIRLENISVAYKDKTVLHSISLRVQEGEKIALVGPSGAGKTTLLNKLYEITRDRAAFVHQDYALVPQLSAFHNIYIGRLDHYPTWYNILNLIKPQKQEVDRVSGILDSLNMTGKIFERVAKLSGGQQQRVAVARAIYRGGDILLADEPISSIDPHQAGNVIKLILKTSRTVIVSLHAVEFALEYFDRLVGLRHGKVHFDLPRKKVTKTLLTELYRT